MPFKLIIIFPADYPLMELYSTSRISLKFALALVTRGQGALARAEYAAQRWGNMEKEDVHAEGAEVTEIMGKEVFHAEARRMGYYETHPPVSSFGSSASLHLFR